MVPGIPKSSFYRVPFAIFQRVWVRQEKHHAATMEQFCSAAYTVTILYSHVVVVASSQNPGGLVVRSDATQGSTYIYLRMSRTAHTEVEATHTVMLGRGSRLSCVRHRIFHLPISFHWSFVPNRPDLSSRVVRE